MNANQLGGLKGPPLAPEIAISDALVIFGGSGDLALRMLYPSLYHLEAETLLPTRLFIIACGRTPRTRQSFIESVRAAIVHSDNGRPIDEGTWARFTSRLDYCISDATS